MSRSLISHLSHSLVALCALGLTIKVTAGPLDCPAPNAVEVSPQLEDQLKKSPLAFAGCGAFFEINDSEDASVSRNYLIEADGYKTNYGWQTYISRSGKYFYWPAFYKVDRIKNAIPDLTFDQLIQDGLRFGQRKKELWPIKRRLKTLADIEREVRRIAPIFAKLGVNPKPVLPVEIKISKLNGKIAAVSPLNKGGDLMEIDKETLEDEYEAPFVYQSIAHELAHLQGLTDESATDMVGQAVLAELASQGDQDYELALVTRVVDQIMYAPFFLIAYNQSLPMSAIDVVLRAPPSIDAGGPDGGQSITRPNDFFTRSYDAINKELLLQRDRGLMDKYLDWKIAIGVLKAEDREENRVRMWKLAPRADFKNAVMAYGLLPYTAYDYIAQKGTVPDDFSEEMEVLKRTSMTSLQNYMKKIRANSKQ
ncbi:MAG: hypothetical protein IT288_04150 [Bdellovibrionales bacterium]|nr:hypothetical protein [Bdellovibrionales bacterium]